MTQFTKEAMAARLNELIAQRDAINAKTAPLQIELDRANAAAQAAQAEANKRAAEIQALRGGQAWLDLKQEIGMLAPLVTRAPAAAQPVAAE